MTADTTKFASSANPLRDPLQYIKGVGPKRAQLLRKLNLNTVEDCLYFLPFRFEDRSQVRNIGELVPGEHATFAGKIINAGTYRIGRRKKIFEVIVQDETGIARAKWFKFNESYMLEKFKTGSQLILSGKPVINRRTGAGFEIVHPDTESMEEGEIDSLEIGRIVPVYHTTEGLHLKSMRTIMKNVLDKYASKAEELLPEDILHRHGFPNRSDAFRLAHYPPSELSAKDLDNFSTAAQQRLIFEELFLIQLALAFRKKHSEETIRGTPLKTRGDLIRKFVKLLRFELTDAQKRVLREIMHDLEQPDPMNLLLQGDVGTGKTIIAVIALLTAVDNGMQAALMAPTEILAEQHYLNIKPWCDSLGVSLELVTSAVPARERKSILERIENGQIQLTIGTHALIQKDVIFDNLGLAVIDEQHRFGVLQREALGKKGVCPHILIMTATPIPRSLALTLYGDMNVAYLDEFPPGRLPIETTLFYEKQREEAYARIRHEVDEGRQAYVVCPLIEGSETSDLKAAQEVHDYLQTGLFPDLNIGLLHGRLKKEERQTIMSDFLARKIHILVATTVIEVGVDVPNATMMIVEHAERFGLSQLHQLRGRVGRGGHASRCFLLAYYPLSEEGKARLEAIRKSNDGFVVAEEDLKIRGPGDFLGTRQSGMPILKVANLLRDIKTLESARREAFALIDRDPGLTAPQHRKLKEALNRTLSETMNLIHVI